MTTSLCTCIIIGLTCLYLQYSLGDDAGHELVLHCSVFDDDPWQFLPPPVAGVLICLVARFCPDPQVFEQLPHADQDDH